MLKLGVIGHPIGHSLSPVLHQRLLQQTGIQGSYQAVDLAPDALACGLLDLEEAGYKGLNVTIPHKITVADWMTQLTPEAAATGAVNTIHFDQGERIGHNTDVAGFLRSLPADVREQTQHWLILGGGGAARAVFMALGQLSPTSVTVATRSPEKLSAWLATQQFPFETRLVTMDKLESLAGFEALAQTTPVGMAPDATAVPLTPTLLNTLPSEGFVYDLIYRPAETGLLQAARQRGCRTQNGLGMLVHQGVAAFEIWTGQTVNQTKIPGLIEELATVLSV